MAEFIHQQPGHGPVCALITLYNACIVHGLPHPTYPSDWWEQLRDLGGARHGTAIHSDRVADELGLERERIPLDLLAANLPAEATVWNADEGTALHSVLVIAVDGNNWTVVNHHSKQPVQETLPVMFNGTYRDTSVAKVVPLRKEGIPVLWAVRKKLPIKKCPM